MKTNRAVKTREALLSAGYDLMMERSVDAIPIDDLVMAAGVGKGSFFNHFGDKEGFKSAIAIQVRGEIETQITMANMGVTDPLERLAGGMREVTNYALSNRRQTLAMLRMTVGATATDYPLNEGMRADIEACEHANLVRTEAKESGILYWLGLCVAVITYVVENEPSRDEAAEKLRHVMLLGLIGMGAKEARAKEIAKRSAKMLGT
ncbi:MAG: TetR/AcrR family transcriptional regulator [Pseudomonadota bacterium]